MDRAGGAARVSGDGVALRRNATESARLEFPDPFLGLPDVSHRLARSGCGRRREEQRPGRRLWRGCARASLTCTTPWATPSCRRPPSTPSWRGWRPARRGRRTSPPTIRAICASCYGRCCGSRNSTWLKSERWWQGAGRKVTGCECPNSLQGHERLRAGQQVLERAVGDASTVQMTFPVPAQGVLDKENSIRLGY